MRIQRLLVLAVVLTSSTVAWMRPASAEWFADLYAGTASTASNDVSVRGTKLDPVGDFTRTHRAVDFDTSVSFGGRVGYWDETWPWFGLALDVSHFRPDASRQTVITNDTDTAESVTAPASLARVDLSVTAIAFDLMLRWPFLKSEQFPKGRLQPYVSGGVAVFVATIDDTTNFGPPNNQSDTDASIGLKASAGVAWQFHKNLVVFGEYRFTRFSPEFSFGPDPAFGADTSGKTRVEMDLNTHHLLVGVSFRF